jgi:hypothetical protein
MRPLALAGLAVALVACSGPDDPVGQRATVTPTATATVPPTPTIEPTATATPEPTATATPEFTPTPAASPTPEPTATATPEPTATPAPVALLDALPRLEELAMQGFTVANQGTRTALELANAYVDPSGHLDRLNQWGFREHYFREFAHQRSGPEDPVPSFFLATINEYGSPEQADEALAWLQSLNLSQGHTEVDPPPFGDNAINSTVPRADGQPTAFLAIREGSRVYVYYAEEGDPLALVQQTAQTLFNRIAPGGQDDATATPGAEATPTTQ